MKNFSVLDLLVLLWLLIIGSIALKRHRKLTLMLMITGFLFTGGIIIVLSKVKNFSVQDCLKYKLFNREEPKIHLKDENINLVSIFKIKEQEQNEEIEAFGTIVPSKKILLVTEVSGIVKYLSDRTAFVNAGDVILSLDTYYHELELKNNENMFKYHEARKKTYEELSKVGAVPQMKVDEELSQMRHYDTKYKQAQETINKCTLVAPFEGKALFETYVEEGGSVIAGKQMGLFFSTDADIEFPLSISDGKNTKIGNKVQLLLENGAVIEGKIHRRDEDLDQHVFIIRAAVGKLPEKASVGMTGTVKVILEEKRRNIYIPDTAIIRMGPKTFVYLLQGDIKERKEIFAVRTEVDVLGTKDGLYLIKGLEEGNTIVALGAEKIGHMTEIKNFDFYVNPNVKGNINEKPPSTFKKTHKGGKQ